MQITFDTLKDDPAFLRKIADLFTQPDETITPEPSPATVFRPIATAVAVAPLSSAPVADSTPLSPDADVTPAPAVVPALPWDARIHSANKSKTIKGEWKYKRGVADEVIAAVEAELRNGGTPQGEAPLPPVSVPPPPPPPPPVTVPPPPVTVPPPPVSVPPASGVVTSVPPSPATGPLNFRQVMAKVTGAALPNATVNELLRQVGLKDDELAPLVMPANAHLLAAFNQLLDAKLAA